MDLLLRDHAIDWGNMEQPSSIIFSSPRKEVSPWQSPELAKALDDMLRWRR